MTNHQPDCTWWCVTSYSHEWLDLFIFEHCIRHDSSIYVKKYCTLSISKRENDIGSHECVRRKQSLYFNKTDNCIEKRTPAEGIQIIQNTFLGLANLQCCLVPLEFVQNGTSYRTGPVRIEDMLMLYIYIYIYIYTYDKYIYIYLYIYKYVYKLEYIHIYIYI